MPTDIFERSKITLSGEILSGHRSARTATFRVSKNGAPLAAPTAPIAGDRCSVEWLTPEVGDAEDFYVLSFEMDVEGRVYKIADSYKVWPRWVQLRVLRVGDLKPFQHFKLRVKQGNAVAAVTDLRGEFMAFLQKPAPVTFDAVAPGEWKGWVVERGRRRIVKAERRYKAEFVAPLKRDKPYLQLVNLATRSKGLDHRGSLVSLRVGAEGDTKRKAAERLGHAGDVIYLQATFGRESKRNSPLPTIDKALDVVRSGDGKTVTAKVKLGALGEPATFDLELGLAGGDTCTLKIGTTPAVADATLGFVNARKIYYQLTYPAKVSEPSLGHMTAGLDAAKVRYKRYKTVTYAEGDSPAAPPGSWFDGAMVSASLSGRCVNIGDHNRGFFHGKFVDTNNPVGVHVLVCHTQFDAGAGNAQLSNVGAVTVEKTSAKVKFPPGTGTPVYGAAIDVSGVGGAVFEMAFQDGGKGWRNVRWRSLAASGPHAGKSGAVPDDHVNVKWRKRPNVVTVKLPDDAVALVEAGVRVSLSLDVYYALGPYNGEAAKNRQLIRVRPPADGGDKGMNGTMLHELGHTLKQTLGNVPPGLSAADHGRQYKRRGHQGPHCGEGIDAAVFGDATRDLAGREDCACVMYGEGAHNRPVAFCAKCKPFVLAEDLRDITQ